MLEWVQETYWEGEGEESGGMEGKEGERMVVRDKQDVGREQSVPLDG